MLATLEFPLWSLANKHLSAEVDPNDMSKESHSTRFGNFLLEYGYYRMAELLFYVSEGLWCALLNLYPGEGCVNDCCCCAYIARWHDLLALLPGDFAATAVACDRWHMWHPTNAKTYVADCTCHVWCIDDFCLVCCTNLCDCVQFS